MGIEKGVLVMNFYRSTMIKGEIWFVLSDICKVLELGQASDFIPMLPKERVQKVYGKPFTQATGAWLVHESCLNWLENKAKVVVLDKEIAKLKHQREALLKHGRTGSLQGNQRQADKV